MISVFMMISGQGMNKSQPGTKVLVNNQKIQNLTDYAYGLNLKELSFENLSK